jgi:hypothetical protein
MEASHTPQIAPHHRKRVEPFNSHRGYDQKTLGNKE